MKTLIFLFIFCVSAAQANCRKSAIANKLVWSMNDMVQLDDYNCAERAQIWAEEGDAIPKFVACRKETMRPEPNCENPSKLFEEVAADVDELPWVRICKRYRPQVEDLYRKCRNIK